MKHYEFKHSRINHLNDEDKKKRISKEKFMENQKSVAKTKWVVVNVPIEQIIKLKDERPYVLINLFKGYQNDKIVERKLLNVNGITTIVSKKLLAKEQKMPNTHLTFVFPSTFSFRLLETKFNEETKIYEDIREYNVSAEEFASIV
jgi:hypothetical protein